MSVVMKMLLPQTIGEEWPRPGKAVFHLMFLSVLHSAGKLVSAETPVPSEPRHADQLVFSAALPVNRVNAAAASKHTATAENDTASFRFIVFVTPVLLLRRIRHGQRCLAAEAKA